MKTALIILLIIVCIVLTILVMKQEGKDAGLTSSLSGSTDTYWSRNKGKSKESMLKKATAVFGALFILIALLLSSKFMK